MAKRILAIGGVPGVGKTTLMNKIIKSYHPLKNFKYKEVRGQYCSLHNMYFIGKYDGSNFAGTDRLSMSVNTSFVDMITKLPSGLFVFEGNRLFNQVLFDNFDCEIYLLTAKQHTIEKRRKRRGANQSKTFLKSICTKINRIQERNKCVLLANNNQSEFDVCYNTICTEIDSWKKQRNISDAEP